MIPDSLFEIARHVRSGDLAAADVVTEMFDRIDRLDGDLNAFRETSRDHALQHARVVDDAVKRGDDPGPLAGVPVAVKDNIVTAWGTTTCGSRFLEQYESPFTATSVEKIEAAGAIAIGKTNCDEFGMGSSSENCAFGCSRNPWDLDRVPGGSSGGSAAAVAAGLCPAALGSETGGSIRQPAALCGIVGVKPTYGRVSRYGLVAFGSSLDQVGPFTTTVADAALMLQVMAGWDPRDSTCSPREVPDYVGGLDKPVNELCLGVPRQYLRDDNDPAVNEAVHEAVELFRGFGRVIEVDLPLTDVGIATYYVIAPAEASGNLARFDGVRYGRRAELEAGDELYDLYARSRAEGFGPEVRRRIMLGTYVLSSGYYDAYYRRALQVRRLIKQEIDATFERCHAIIGPTTPTPAFKVGETSDPLAMYLNDVYTTNTNIAGICGISVPCGMTEVDGVQLPIGLQIQCRAFDEATMFRVARLLEANRPAYPAPAMAARR